MADGTGRNRTSRAPIKIGVSLKLYFGYRETLTWCRRVARLVRRHPAVQSGAVEVFIIPTAPALGVLQPLFSRAGIRLGAQDVSREASGAFTGEIGAPFLKDLGCTYVEIGHAERRRLFGEADELVARKVAMCAKHGITPLVCIGETEKNSPAKAARDAIRQLRSALSQTKRAPLRLVAAYEPVWAIGASEPAGVDHIIGVCRRIQTYLDRTPRLAGSTVIYGGSAGPGLLSQLEGAVGGLFLGRFAHDTRNLAKVLDEAGEVAANRR